MHAFNLINKHTSCKRHAAARSGMTSAGDTVTSSLYNDPRAVSMATRKIIYSYFKFIRLLINLGMDYEFGEIWRF